jgi:hypothetical protein
MSAFQAWVAFCLFISVILFCFYGVGSLLRKGSLPLHLRVPGVVKNEMTDLINWLGKKVSSLLSYVFAHEKV